MRQEYTSFWQNTLQHSQKREFYRSFKTDHTTSSYLEEQLREEKGFSKTTNKQSQTNDRNRLIQSNYEG